MASKLWRMLWRHKVLRGTDRYGNQYYEKEKMGGRIQRSVKMLQSNDPSCYTSQAVPPEWDRWLKGTRQHPPTDEEQEKRITFNEQMKAKIKELELKDLQEPPQKTVTDHASAPSYQHKEGEAASTGSNFQPSPWKPPTN